jgi:uncharacterized membrane protein
MMWPWMWGGWILMGVGMLIVGILIVVGSYVLLTEFTRPRTSRRNDALEIARLRYARGDITLEEFERIIRNL